MKKRILVVDDDARIREFLTTALGDRGFDTDVARDGLEALGMIERHRYDLIITDFQMPVMNGADLARAVKQKNLSCSIVAITGCPDPSDLVEAGVDFTITKPFSFQDITAVIHKALSDR